MDKMGIFRLPFWELLELVCPEDDKSRFVFRVLKRWPSV
jgi:hypothetical protein